MAASVVPGASGPLAAGLSVWEVFDAWLRRASAVITESADALDALNVFPISDADTGTNLRLTLSGIARAVPDVNRASLGAVVQAAILSAHGNSGAIVAEMFSSVCRSLEHDPTASAGPAGVRVALLLQTVADAARRAVARPVAGTILTVADDAAQAARQAAQSAPSDALAVAEAAQLEARAALARTPQQLEVLAAGGVVDAGGQAYALLVDALVEVLGGAPARPLPAGGHAPRAVAAPAGTDYEVMYALRGAGPEALAGLRARLAELGHSVVVVGDGHGDEPLAQVHVHLTEPGPAIEAALPLGTVSQIRVTALEPVALGTRTLVALVPGPGLAQAVRDAGAVAVLTGTERVADELRAVLQRLLGDVVVLPHDTATSVTATTVLHQLRSGRPVPASRRLAALPLAAPVQALAALAVHDPAADFDVAVAAMSAAAGHVRHGAVQVSPDGDLLGLVDGAVVLTGETAAQTAGRVAGRLLAAGGELLTLVLGADAPEGLATELERHVQASCPDVDVQVLSGGQPDVLVLGVE